MITDLLDSAHRRNNFKESVMRGLFLISVLIALAVVGYLQTRSATTALESDTADNKIQEVEQEVNAMMQDHMQNLQRQTQQE